MTNYRSQVVAEVLPFVNASRDVISRLCYAAVIFTALLTASSLLGSVLWVYMKRCVRVVYQLVK